MPRDDFEAHVFVNDGSDAAVGFLFQVLYDRAVLEPYVAVEGSGDFGALTVVETG